MLKDLKEGFIDLALIEGVFVPRIFSCHEITRDKLLVVTSNTSPWREKNKISLKEFMEAPLIVREKGSGNRETMEKHLKRAGLKLDQCNVVAELHSLDAIKAAVVAGRGISVLPRLALKAELHLGTLLGLEIEELPMEQTIHLVYYKCRVQGRLAQAFIKFLRSPQRGFC